MVLGRRAFTFGSLAALILPSVALADVPEVEAATPPDSKKEGLDARFSVNKNGDANLVIGTTLVNQGKKPMDVIVGRGSRPGPYLRAFLDGGEPTELADVTPYDRRDMISRMGPMPVWQTLASGGEVVLKPYLFALPAGVGDGTVSLVDQVDTRDGNVEIRADNLGWSRKT